MLRSLSRLLCTSGLALPFLFPGAAQAQEVSSAAPPPEASPAAAGTGEIVVTAQKREQNIQKVGIAVTAIGQSGLAALGRQDVSALVTQVPALQVQQYAPTITVFNIRGVSQNDFADSQEAPIAFYNDGVYVSALGAISGQTFDLERVEVLRGPQGTLFGRNATGGLVQVVTAKPTSTLEGFITGTAASYGQFSSEGAISGPLSETLRARLSFTTTHGGDYLRNLTGHDLGSQKFYAGRFQLAGEAGASGKFNLKLYAMRNDHERSAGLYTHATTVPNALGLGEFVGPNDNPYGTCPGCDALGYKGPGRNPYVVAYDQNNFFSRTYYGGTLNYVQDIGSVALTSISDYQHLKKAYLEDDDVSPVDNFHYRTGQNLDQVSQEFRLSQDTDRLHWVAGLYGIVIHTKNRYDTNTTGAFGLDEVYRSTLNTKSIAGFGQVEYALTDTVSGIGGFRYSYDRKRYNFRHFENGVNDFTFNRGIYPDLASKGFGNWSGKVELNYKPDTNMLFYASVNRGTKSGGFGTPAFPPFDPNLLPFKQEVLTDYEGGAKLTLFNNTTHLNLAGFYYHYHNYQSFEAVGVSLVVRNKQARLKGLELEFNTRPVRGLYLSAFASLLDTEVRNVTLPSGAVRDRKMPQAPGVSIGWTARYEAAVGPGNLAVQTNWKYDGYQYFTDFNAPVDREPSRVVGNVRVSYAPRSFPIEAAFFVNNVTDKQYRLYNFDLSTVFGYTQQTFARPRWFGGSLTYRLK